MIISEKPVELKLDNYLWGSRRENVSASAVVFHTGTVLHVNFSVSESELRRMVNEPNGMVWTDSCVEIFIKAEDSDEYTNIECSASGAFLACHGPGRKDRIRYSAEERSAVSTDVAILENNNKRSRWEMKISVDLARLGLISGIPADIAFNLYKCGDELREPHFLSFAPISTQEPDFHRTEFFEHATLV